MEPKNFVPFYEIFLPQLLNGWLHLIKLVTGLWGESGSPVVFACQEVAKERPHDPLPPPGHGNRHQYEPVAKHLNVDPGDNGDATVAIKCEKQP